MVFPFNSITKNTILLGPSEEILVNNFNQKFILGVKIQQSGTASETTILCGTDLVAKNYAKDFNLDLIYKECNGVIKVEKTGQDDAFVSLTYYEGNLNEQNALTLVKNTETGAEFFVEKTLNYGEAMILWFLTMFAFYLIFKVTYNFFWKK